MAYVGETDVLLGAAATQVRTSSYSPAGSTLLLGMIYGTYNSLPWAAYGGGGSPGDGVNSYTLIGQAWDTGGVTNFALASAPSVGATSVALNVGYGGATGNVVVVFNSGETRACHVTNGVASIPDTGTFAALTGVNVLGQSVALNSTVLISGNPNVIGLYQVPSSSNAAVQFGASSAATQLTAAALIEYSGLSPCAAFNFNHNGAPGTGANGVVGGNVSFTQSGTLLGFGFDLQSSSALTAGTSPLAFNGRAVMWNSAFTQGLLEDAGVISANSPAQATFKGGNQFDAYSAWSAFFPSSTNASATPTAGSVTLAGQTPGLVRGAVVTPHVASGRILVPSRRIFLPPRSSMMRPHV